MHLQGLIGMILLLGIAFILSNNRRQINYRIIVWGLSLQFIFGILILKTPLGKPLFGFFDKVITKLISFSDAGSDFLFKSLVPGVGYHEAMVNFAFRALPTIIFFSSLMTVLYHFGVIQFIVKWISRIMQKSMGTSGSETLSVAANIFVGQTEAPLMIRPFIRNMTQSELMAVMTGGFATVAGGVLALYVIWLKDIPGIAGHLLAASVMSAPAAMVVAKIIYPETDLSEMLVAFVALVAMINYFLTFADTSLQGILGFVFRPLAWAMGISWEEAQMVGVLMGEKITLTELIAYSDLRDLRLEQAISDRTAIIASYALCGFANYASIGIQLGGIGGIAPERRKDLASLALKAMLGGALASWMTASIAGILI